MSTKKVSFGTKPAKPEATTTPDEWVKNRDEAAGEPMKRLTIDVPSNLHRKIKSSCAARGVKMADEIREILEKNYAGGGGDL